MSKAKKKPTKINIEIDMDAWRDCNRLSVELKVNGEAHTMASVINRLLEDAGEKTIFK